jgi:hypothetical protein
MLPLPKLSWLKYAVQHGASSSDRLLYRHRVLLYIAVNHRGLLLGSKQMMAKGLI